jgi:DNA-directed RNA polymerase subunit alpha
VRRVTFTVEPTRVEQSTNYDRLVLDIETDGSITPREALASAGDTLRKLVGLVAEMSDEPQGLELGEVAAGHRLARPRPAHRGPRPVRASPQLPQAGPGQHHRRAAHKTEDDLLAITNFGQKSLDEVIEKLDERGLSLRTD